MIRKTLIILNNTANFPFCIQIIPVLYKNMAAQLTGRHFLVQSISHYKPY